MRPVPNGNPAAAYGAQKQVVDIMSAVLFGKVSAAEQRQLTCRGAGTGPTGTHRRAAVRVDNMDGTPRGSSGRLGCKYWPASDCPCSLL